MIGTEIDLSNLRNAGLAGKWDNTNEHLQIFVFAFMSLNLWNVIDLNLE